MSPCVNGFCYGETDPNCTSTERAHSFEGISVESHICSFQLMHAVLCLDVWGCNNKLKVLCGIDE